MLGILSLFYVFMLVLVVRSIVHSGDTLKDVKSGHPIVIENKVYKCEVKE